MSKWKRVDGDYPTRIGATEAQRDAALDLLEILVTASWSKANQLWPTVEKGRGLTDHLRVEPVIDCKCPECGLAKPVSILSLTPKSTVREQVDKASQRGALEILADSLDEVLSELSKK